jgi:hypothetical protein
MQNLFLFPNIFHPWLVEFADAKPGDTDSQILYTYTHTHRDRQTNRDRQTYRKTEIGRETKSKCDKS